MMMDLQHLAAGHFFVTVEVKGQKLKVVEFFIHLRISCLDFSAVVQ
ncbi:hypothetical protein NSQ90_23640 [Paenibacillus sp. FSL H7-0737]